MSRTVILLTALLAMAPSLGAQEAAPDTVAPWFDWPVGLTARVTHARQQVLYADVASEGELQDTSGAVLVYTMRVGGHPGGRLISHDDLAVELLPGSNHFTELLLLQQTMEAMVSLVVTDDGLGVSVDSTALNGMFAASRSLLEPVFASLPKPRPGPWKWDGLDVAHLQQFAVVRAMEAWAILVAAFADGELELGAVVTSEIDGELPMYAGATVPFVHEFMYSGREPCAGSAKELSCVVLEITSTPDQEALTSVVDSVAAAWTRAKGLPYARMVSSRVETHVRLVTEPRGLIPHRLELRRYQRQDMARGDEKGGTEMIIRDTFDFEYVSR